MFITVRLKDIIDIQTIILFHLDTNKFGTEGRETVGIPIIAKIYSIDQATVRRNIKGDGKRHPYEKSLLGKGLMIEVRNGVRTEYMITDKGHIEICERKNLMKKIVG